MGKFTASTSETALNLDAASFTVSGASNGDFFQGTFNLVLNFSTGAFVGSATLQRSFDAGATWQSVTDDTGNIATWSGDLNCSWDESETGVMYRWNVTRTSGTLATRISQ